MLYFLLYMSSYQINFQFKNFQKLMDLNCLPQNLTTNLDYQKSANICFFFCKHYYFFLGKRWSNSCDCSNVIHQKFWKFLNLNFIWKNVYTRNITQLLDSLNYNYGNFFRFDQMKCQCFHKIMHFKSITTYFIFFLIKF